MLVAQPGHVAVPFHQQPDHPSVIIGSDLQQPFGPQRRNGDRAGVVGVILLRLARCRGSGRDANIGGTSNTVSPAATSCWATR